MRVLITIDLFITRKERVTVDPGRENLPTGLGLARSKYARQLIHFYAGLQLIHEEHSILGRLLTDAESSRYVLWSHCDPVQLILYSIHHMYIHPIEVKGLPQHPCSRYFPFQRRRRIPARQLHAIDCAVSVARCAKVNTLLFFWSRLQRSCQIGADCGTGRPYAHSECS